MKSPGYQLEEGPPAASFRRFKHATSIIPSPSFTTLDAGPISLSHTGQTLLSDGIAPRWTPENRPVVDGGKPASWSAAPSTSVLPRSIVIEQVIAAASSASVEGIAR
jgi:hypothetical protein